MGDTAKQFSIQNFRPEGFEFPAGLNGANTGSTFDIISTTPAPGNYSFPATSIGGTAEVLVIAGGGGGGSVLGGGGGGGGLVYHSSYPYFAKQAASISIGSGGVSAGPGPADTGPTSTKGSNTTFGSITAIGGGAGRASGGGGGSTTDVSGGSSGGGNYYEGPTGGLTTTVQQGPSGGGTGYGNAGAGGSGFNPANPGGNYSLGGGGGGGAGGTATQHPLSAPDAPYKATNGNAGAGLAYTLVGETVYYSGGGGGQYQNRTGSPSNGETVTYGGGANTSFGIGASARIAINGAAPGAVIIKYFVNTYSVN
jgi:hypothetical protein